MGMTPLWNQSNLSNGNRAVTAVKMCPNHQTPAEDSFPTLPLPQGGGGGRFRRRLEDPRIFGVDREKASPEHTEKGFLQTSLVPHLQSNLNCPDKLQFEVQGVSLELHST